MPDFMDLIQDAEARAGERLHAAARLPDFHSSQPRDCIDCDEDIDHRRLAVVPNALRCTFCEELLQQQAMHFRRRTAGR